MLCVYIYIYDYIVSYYMLLHVICLHKYYIGVMEHCTRNHSSVTGIRSMPSAVH